MASSLVEWARNEIGRFQWFQFLNYLRTVRLDSSSANHVEGKMSRAGCRNRSRIIQAFLVAEFRYRTYAQCAMPKSAQVLHTSDLLNIHSWCSCLMLFRSGLMLERAKTCLNTACWKWFCGHLVHLISTGAASFGSSKSIGRSLQSEFTSEDPKPRESSKEIRTKMQERSLLSTTPWVEVALNFSQLLAMANEQPGPRKMQTPHLLLCNIYTYIHIYMI